MAWAVWDPAAGPGAKDVTGSLCIFASRCGVAYGSAVTVGFSFYVVPGGFWFRKVRVLSSSAQLLRNSEQSGLGHNFTSEYMDKLCHSKGRTLNSHPTAGCAVRLTGFTPALPPAACSLGALPRL